MICPEASSAQNNIVAVSGDGRTVWVLLELFVPTVTLGSKRVNALRCSSTSFGAA